MAIELPTADQLQKVNDTQRANAAELIDYMHELDTEVLIPGWEMRTAIMHQLNDRYSGLGDRVSAMRVAVTLAVTESVDADDAIKSRIEETVGGSVFGNVLEWMNGYSFGVGQADGMSDIVAFRKSAARNEGIDRELLRADPRFVDELVMLGFEFKVAALQGLLNDAAYGQRWADLDLFIGVDDEQGTADGGIDWVEEAMDEIIIQADEYSSKRRKGLIPIDPEKLVGLTKGALESMGIIPPNEAEEY